MENATEYALISDHQVVHKSFPSKVRSCPDIFAYGDNISVSKTSVYDSDQYTEVQKNEEIGSGDTLDAKYDKLSLKSHDSQECIDDVHDNYEPEFNDTMLDAEIMKITSSIDESKETQIHPRIVEANTLNYWRDLDHHHEVLNSFEKHGMSFKYVKDWSTEVEESNRLEQFPHLPRISSKFALDDSNIGQNMFGENEQTELKREEEEEENLIRIRYTRDYLMKFADCILAHAFPDGLRKFTATGQLPLKQLENTTTEVEPRRRPPLPNVYGGMEHILFYNDVHYISHSKRSVVKF